MRAIQSNFFDDRPPTSVPKAPAQQRAAAPPAARPEKRTLESGPNTAPKRSHVFLGNTTKLPSAPVITAEDAERRKLKRHERFRLREGLARITTNPRVAACGRGLVTKDQMPDILVQGEGDGRVAHYGGVRLCGCVHGCPNCGPRIRQRKSEDIDAGAQVWLQRHGVGSVMLGTFTLPHDYGERLDALLRTVSESFGAMISGRQWQDDKAEYGVRHYIVAHDATVGINGWHPHLHALFFSERVLDDAQVARLQDRLFARWSRAVTRRGQRAPSRDHGVVLERARTRRDVARYIAQVVAGDEDDTRTKPVALEMARGDLKRSRMEGHRSPWQLLSDIVERRARAGSWSSADDAADDTDVALWHEWERAMKGVPSVRWSRGLRVEVGLDVEQSDEEIVAEEVGGVRIYQFAESHHWRAVAETPGGRSSVLRAAERGGVTAVRALVDELHRHWERRRFRLMGYDISPEEHTSPAAAARRRKGVA